MLRRWYVPLAASCLLTGVPAAPARAEGPTPPAADAATPAVRFEGFIDSYWSYKFGAGRSDNALRVYDLQNNTFVPAYAELAMISDNAPVGFRLDLGFGPVADLTNFDTDPQNPNTSAVTEVFKHIQQAYVSWKAPTPFPLQLDAGKFVTSAGAEYVESKDNWNYSRALIFGWGPFTHTGLRLTSTEILPKLTLQASLVNGWDWVMDDNDFKTFGFQAAYTAPWGTSFALTTYHGPEGTSADWRNLVDLVVGHDFTDRLHGKLNGIYGTEGTGIWYAGAAYGKFDILPHLYLAARAEYFNDPQGVRLGQKNAAGQPLGVGVGSGTLTLGVPLDKIEFRGELRHDIATAALYDGGKAPTQTTLQAAALARF